MYIENGPTLQNFARTVREKGAHLKPPLKLRRSKVQWPRNTDLTLAILSGELSREEAIQKFLNPLLSYDRTTAILITTTRHLLTNLPPDKQDLFPLHVLTAQIKRLNRNRSR